MNFRNTSIALVASAGLLGGVGMANAADMSRPVYKAPMVAPAFSWTGLYVGAVAGYAWGEADIAHNGILGLAGLSTMRTKPDGWLAGGTVGYNYQQGNLVLGTEGEFYWSNLDGSATTSLPLGGGTFVGTYSNNWTGTLSTRLGVAFDTILVYSKAGVAWANNDYTLGIVAPAASVSMSETETGWLVGGGVEWAFARNWSAKIEGTYMNFGSKSREFPTPVVPAPVSIDANVSTVKFGVNYRFY